ncbi:hypothetical protein CEXT_311521 [Caerostris extrusa]|uniref:Uncharacterized protein n=1 Tax=Caerostris extrusa TaxID=172846 RepID=A0AAV4XEQ3_CAEEX|nr:hypothetical protein CEXT_311521 [Caerostris extrusa]
MATSSPLGEDLKPYRKTFEIFTDLEIYSASFRYKHRNVCSSSIAGFPLFGNTMGTNHQPQKTEACNFIK